MSRDLASLLRPLLSAEVIVDDPEVIERRYRRNVTGLSREVPVVLRPRDEDEVRRIVSVANAHAIALYPISTGRNWGLGSKLPVTDGCAIVDLSAMTRIVEVNDEFGYAIIEPGVTQHQLAACLRASHPGLTINFTGSFGLTSIVGNTLDRGDGEHARIRDLLGVRGILGSGAPFHAGGIWSHVGTGEPSHHVQFTAGPDLTTLFTQSNFGVVTQMAFKLLRRPPRTLLLWGIVPDSRLDAAVEILRTLGQQGVFNPESLQLGYGNRFVHAAEALDARAEDEANGWLFYLFIAGTARTADAAAGEVLDALSPLCLRIGAFDEKTSQNPERELPTALHPILKLLRGAPDTDSIKVVYQATGVAVPDDPRELDADGPPFGLKSHVGVIPFTPRHVRALDRLIAETRAHGIAVKPSIYGDGRVLVTLSFRRDDPVELARATAAEDTLWNAMAAAGFAPYRVAIDRMESLVARDPAFFDVVASIRSALDPNGIIAPGRYARTQPPRGGDVTR